MSHEHGHSNYGNDFLRARFTMWLNTTLIHARQRYLETHMQKLVTVPLDKMLEETLIDPADCFALVEDRHTDFDFAEEKLAKAFAELPLMRREVLRLLFVEERTSEEVATRLCISTNCVYQFKHQALKKLRRALEEGEDQYE